MKTYRQFKIALFEGTAEYKRILGDDLFKERWVQKQLEWARNVLKKTNRIEWLCTVIKAIDEIVKNNYQVDYSNPVQKSIKTGMDFDWYGRIDYPTEDIVQELITDLADLKFLTVPDIMFTNNGAHPVIDVYKAIKKSRDEFIGKNHLVPDPGRGEDSSSSTSIIEFDDGFYWRLLSKGACAKEGQAMGHCGNVPSQKSGDRILSLRNNSLSQVEDYAEVFLTFILDSYGYIREARGRYNTKPDESLHRYIVELLKDKLIKMINATDIYTQKLQDQFVFNDLSDAQQKEVKKANPRLIFTEEDPDGDDEDNDGDVPF